MAVAEIIGAAVGVLLLVIVAYLLVGGTLSMAETVATAQKDLTSLQEARLRTSIDITYPDFDDGANILKFNISNNGNEMISDLPHMDIFSFNETNGYTYYTYDSYQLGNPGNWSITGFEHDYIHAKELDPGVSMSVNITYLPDNKPISFQVTTSNGVSALSSV
jgi:flagellar protein FlaF